MSDVPANSLQKFDSFCADKMCCDTLSPLVKIFIEKSFILVYLYLNVLSLYLNVFLWCASFALYLDAFNVLCEAPLIALLLKFAI